MVPRRCASWWTFWLARERQPEARLPKVRLPTGCRYLEPRGRQSRVRAAERFGGVLRPYGERPDGGGSAPDLDRLPDEQREGVLLCDLWGFRYEEIASIVDCPVGTVRSRVARGRDRLAELLADTAHEPGVGGLGR